MKAQKLSTTAACFCFLILCSFAASGPLAQAQQFTYCKSDVHRLCAGIRPGEGRLAHCLKAHVNEVSIGCAKELKKVKSNMSR
jgi:cysteine rich repeat protein